MFPNEKNYLRAKNSGVLNSSLIEELYHVNTDDIVIQMFFDPAPAWKFTLKRPSRSFQDSIGENDTFGTQQHAPLSDIEIP